LEGAKERREGGRGGREGGFRRRLEREEIHKRQTINVRVCSHPRKELLLLVVVWPGCRRVGRTQRREGPREGRREEERSCG